LIRTTQAIVICFFVVILTAAPGWAQEDLAKQSQNPVGNIISVPFENNTSFGVGPEDAVVNTLNLKPVFPVTYQEERIAGEGSRLDLAVTVQAAFSEVNLRVGPVWRKTFR
jgi:hypothetical protein